MARVFITGSADGLGLMAARQLLLQGHEVILHARNEARARDAAAALPQAQQVLVADLSSIAQSRARAAQVNRLGRLDAVIHNAAVGYREARRITTEDGLPHVFAINTLAPYILAALIERPQRLVFLSSGLHRGAGAHLDDLTWTTRRWNGLHAYSESKLHDVLLAFALARYWPGVFCNALEPGWVPTKMGGPQAPDDLAQGYATQVWLAAGQDPRTQVSGCYFYHLELAQVDPAARDHKLQDALLEECHRYSDVVLARG
jgi:NAD(P)-dependent dehydrogenase (short-subunit alcohol dehydrogenase family)